MCPPGCGICCDVHPPKNGPHMKDLEKEVLDEHEHWFIRRPFNKACRHLDLETRKCAIHPYGKSPGDYPIVCRNFECHLSLTYPFLLRMLPPEMKEIIDKGNMKDTMSLLSGIWKEFGKITGDPDLPKKFHKFSTELPGEQEFSFDAEKFMRDLMSTIFNKETREKVFDKVLKKFKS